MAHTGLFRFKRMVGIIIGLRPHLSLPGGMECQRDEGEAWNFLPVPTVLPIARIVYTDRMMPARSLGG